MSCYGQTVCKCLVIRHASFYLASSAQIALRPIPRLISHMIQARGEARKRRGFGLVTLASEELQQKVVRGQPVTRLRPRTDDVQTPSLPANRKRSAHRWAMTIGHGSSRQDDARYVAVHQFIEWMVPANSILTQEHPLEDSTYERGARDRRVVSIFEDALGTERRFKP